MGKLREAAEKYIAWHDGDNAEALLKAVEEAENTMRWIPVVERLPETSIPVWVTRKLSTGNHVSVDTYYMQNWKWYDDGSVIAWKPKDEMPEPYRSAD